MANENPCPDKSALVGYLLGTFPESDVQQLESHVEHCSVCEETLLQLEQSSDTVMQAVRRNPTADIAALAAAPELRGAVERLQALVISDLDSSEDEYEQRDAHKGGRTTYPSSFGPYRLVEPLGHGGMGTVFRGFHQRLNKPVAIKIVAAASCSTRTLCHGSNARCAPSARWTM